MNSPKFSPAKFSAIWYTTYGVLILRERTLCSYSFSASYCTATCPVMVAILLVPKSNVVVVDYLLLEDNLM